MVTVPVCTLASFSAARPAHVHVPGRQPRPHVCQPQHVQYYGTKSKSVKGRLGRPLPVFNFKWSSGATVICTGTKIIARGVRSHPTLANFKLKLQGRTTVKVCACICMYLLVLYQDLHVSAGIMSVYACMCSYYETITPKMSKYEM
jgi:hypothetical protein